MDCKFDHVHILTTDPEAVALWFEKMFDAEIMRSMQMGKPRIDVKLGGQMIFLMPVSASDTRPAPEHTHLGLDHFGVSVTDIDAVYEDLKQRGAEFTQHVATQRPGIRLMFVKGPEGISVEILERNEKYC